MSNIAPKRPNIAQPKKSKTTTILTPKADSDNNKDTFKVLNNLQGASNSRETKVI